MLDSPVYVVTIILALLAFAEFLSLITKAWIPSLLVIMAGYLALLWTGVLPPDLIPKSALTTVGAVLVGAVITHMGTLIPLAQIKTQYKAILIALTGIVFGAILILAVLSPILGYPTAVAGTGPVTGGLIAYLITSQKLTEAGLDSLVAVSAIVLGLQSLVGLPLANILLRKYATKMRDRGDFDVPATASDATGPGYDGAAGPATGAGTVLAPAPRRGLQLLPEKFQQPSILLFALFVAASLATWLDALTGLNYGVWALLLGLLGRVLGVFPEKAMEKANAFGFGLIAVIVVIMASISTVTFATVKATIGPAILILVVGAVGIMFGGWLASKLFKWDPLKGMSVALTALFGFPGDFMLCQEVSRSVGRDERERAAIFDELVTPMLVAGFTTVTTASILVASILVTTL